jgi:hypothetical protein
MRQKPRFHCNSTFEQSFELSKGGTVTKQEAFVAKLTGALLLYIYGAHILTAAISHSLQQQQTDKGQNPTSTPFVHFETQNLRHQYIHNSLSLYNKLGRSNWEEEA